MKYVPNALTIGRIVVTPLVLVLLMTGTLWAQLGALALFVAAAISDYFDGKLARTYGAGSRLGQFLDPFADKVLVLGTFTALAFLIPDVVPWWAVALVALRDLGVTGLRTWAEANGRSLRTLPMAKTKTTVQLTFLIATLVFLAFSKAPGVVGQAATWMLESVILYGLLLAVVVVTVATGVLYAVRQEYTSPAEVNG